MKGFRQASIITQAWKRRRCSWVILVRVAQAWSGAGWAMGASRGVGFLFGGLGVVPVPVAGVAVARGVLFGATFQRADARFNGPIVTRGLGR